MKILKLPFVVLLLAIIASCSKTADTVKPVTPANINGVDAAGYEVDASGNYVAKYWKNGVATALTDQGRSTQAYALYASATDIYVAGSAYNGAGFIATLWKNGVVTELGDPLVHSEAYALCTSGSDVYVAGVGVSGKNYMASLWKNGKVAVLNGGIYGSDARAVQVIGSDVYAAGVVYVDSAGSDIYTSQRRRQATIWKNGTATTLSKGKYYADANALYVSGNDVYIAGTLYNPTDFGAGGTAVVWKNGVAQTLGTGLTDYTDSEINGLCVSGTDVYAVGYNSNFQQRKRIATVWKNGIGTALTDGSSDAVADAVFISGKDIYVSGYITSKSGHKTATVWKNGVATALADGTNYSEASALFVKS